MFTKSCPVRIKAAGEAEGMSEGQFTALVSVFGNVDSYGDVVMPGAFSKTLDDWRESGNPIPCYYSHRMDDPDLCIGEVLEASETDEGLLVKVQLDLDDEAKKARQVYRLLKGRRVTQFSFAYDVVDGGPRDTKEGEPEAYELRELKLYEVGPTPIGANQATELIAIKTANELARATVDAVKAGRVLSSKNEAALREAHSQLAAAADQIADVLTAVEAINDPEKSAQPRTPAPPTDPISPPASEPPVTGPAVPEAKADALAALAALSIRERDLL